MYDKVPTEDLKARLRRLDANGSAQTMTEELQRQHALQEMRSELQRRGEHEPDEA